MFQEDDINKRKSTHQITESRARSIIRERDAQIAALEKQVTSLTNKLINLKQQEYSISKSNESQHSNVTYKRRHKLTPYGNIVQESPGKSGKKGYLINERSQMGRNASIATAEELRYLSAAKELSDHETNEKLVNRILNMFKEPSSHIEYLKSQEFAKDLLLLNSKVRHILESEPRVVFLQSPAYVFGDIHGNLEDLHFFSDNIWRLGMSLTAGNFVFLGDYVDRGMSCLECVAYLFAMKLLLPHKVFLLRGNHETRDVNGWEDHYGERSFIYQCMDRFGVFLGHKVWECTNQVFDRLPLAAVIDQNIFCVHGGIPRPITQLEDGSLGSRIQDILNVPKVAGINPPYEHEDDDHQQVASDCIWSDPASEQQEHHSVDPVSGYGESLRGGGAICFGHKAVNDFLDQHGFSFIMRAHEAHADGVAVSKGGKVFTIFSTSKDHNQGNQALAGCILVDFEKMQVINRSPAYRNQYVHRRDSVSLDKLSEREIEQRVQLGLVTEVVMEEGDDEEEFEELHSDEEDDYDENDSDVEEENFRFSSRKSSVDPCSTVASPLGSSHDNHIWTDRSSSISSISSVTRTLDFSHVATSNRRLKRNLDHFSIIREELEESDDEKTINEDDIKMEG